MTGGSFERLVGGRVVSHFSPTETMFSRRAVATRQVSKQWAFGCSPWCTIHGDDIIERVHTHLLRSVSLLFRFSLIGHLPGKTFYRHYPTTIVISCIPTNIGTHILRYYFLLIFCRFYLGFNRYVSSLFVTRNTLRATVMPRCSDKSAPLRTRITVGASRSTKVPSLNHRVPSRASTRFAAYSRSVRVNLSPTPGAPTHSRYLALCPPRFSIFFNHLLTLQSLFLLIYQIISTR